MSAEGRKARGWEYHLKQGRAYKHMKPAPWGVNYIGDTSWHAPRGYTHEDDSKGMWPPRYRLVKR